MSVIGVAGKASKSCFFDGGVVIIIMIVDTDNSITPIQQSQCQNGTNKSGRTGDKDLHFSHASKSHCLALIITMHVANP